MAANTKIEWTDATFNPWISCTKISPACDNCYAAVSTPVRALKIEWGAGKPRHRTSQATWKQPLVWERQHQSFFAENGRRRRVFCASLADVFDNEVDPQWRADLFELIRATPHLDWLVLTKRIGNAEHMIETALRVCDRGSIEVPGGGKTCGKCMGHGCEQLPRWPWPNVWLGATIANQPELERDIYKIVETPARWKFISYEPALGALDFTGIWIDHANPATHENALEAIDLVIAGGESGHGARSADVEWFRSLAGQCKAVGTSFFMKQLGGARDKRGNLEDLPHDLRVREFPTTERA